MPGSTHLEVDDARAPGERRLHLDRARRRLERVDAVEQDPRPHHVQVRVGQAQERRGVGDVPQRRRQRVALVEAQHLVEALELQPRGRQVLGIGIGEVRVDALDLDVRRARGRLEQGSGAVVVDADPLHAGVDLEVDARLAAVSRGRLLDVGEPRERGHREGEPVLEEQRDLPGPDPAHHQDRVLDAERPQRDALLHERHAEGVGLRREAAGHRLEAVAVGVGLEDGHDLRSADVGLDGREVRAEPRQADGGVGGPESRLVGVDRRQEVHRRRTG